MSLMALWVNLLRTSSYGRTNRLTGSWTTACLEFHCEWNVQKTTSTHQPYIPKLSLDTIGTRTLIMLALDSLARVAILLASFSLQETLLPSPTDSTSFV